MSTTATYLDRIVPAVRRRVYERSSRLPLAKLQATSGPGRRPSFVAAMSAPGMSLIAEVKRASPSKGPIRPDLEVRELVQAYEQAGARAISVLTEQDHFLGSPDDLRAAVETTTLPVLQKDFIIEAYQVHEARVWGASAVLLIAALLGEGELLDLCGLARRLGMDVLLEVHDEAELARALAVDGAIIGVNNRDLRTFAVSLETTERLVGLVPPERLLVSESGIQDHADVVRLASIGVEGVLVGESLLRASDVGVAARALMEPLPSVGARPVGKSQSREAG